MKDRRGFRLLLLIAVLIWLTALVFIVVTTFLGDPDVVPAAPPEISSDERSGVRLYGLEDDLDPIDEPD